MGSGDFETALYVIRSQLKYVQDFNYVSLLPLNTYSNIVLWDYRRVPSDVFFKTSMNVFMNEIYLQSYFPFN